MGKTYLNGFVVLVYFGLLPQVLNDRMVGVDFEVFLGCHVTHCAGVSQGLGLHDSLHVGTPTILTGDNTARRGFQSVGHNYLQLQNGEQYLEK